MYSVHPKEHFSSLSRERGAQWREHPPTVALEGGDWSGLLESGAERSAFFAGIAALSSTDDRRPGSLQEAGTPTETAAQRRDPRPSGNNTLRVEQLFVFLSLPRFVLVRFLEE